MNTTDDVPAGIYTEHDVRSKTCERRMRGRSPTVQAQASSIPRIYVVGWELSEFDLSGSAAEA